MNARRLRRFRYRLVSWRLRYPGMAAYLHRAGQFRDWRVKDPNDPTIPAGVGNAETLVNTRLV